jgi:hypothetical protein
MSLRSNLINAKVLKKVKSIFRIKQQKKKIKELLFPDKPDQNI